MGRKSSTHTLNLGYSAAISIALLLIIPVVTLLELRFLRTRLGMLLLTLIR